MNTKEKLDFELDSNEHITLDNLIILYKATIEKLESCARYSPSENTDQNLDNFKTENAQILLQDKIMYSVLNRHIAKLSDVAKILNFWRLCVLSTKKVSDYEDSDHLILKSLAYIEAS